MHITIHQLTRTALMAALICVLAPIAVPLGNLVPISLATLAVMTAGALCGPYEGAMAVILYILLGILGLPVFAGFTSGAAAAFGMTGGYIIGYIPLAVCTGIASAKLSGQTDRKTAWLVLACGMLGGTLLLYALGTAWFMKFTGMGLGASLSACVIPFLAGDAVKMVLVCILYDRLAPYIKKR